MLAGNPFLKHEQAPMNFAADDPVGGLEHSLPLHPDHGSSRPMEYWEDHLHKKRPRKPSPQPSPEKPRQDDHQVDDYA